MSFITFIWPFMLVTLILVPVSVAAYALLQRRKLSASSKNLSFMQDAMGRFPAGMAGMRRHIPPTLFLSGLTILMVALARPQMLVSLPKEEGTVILAFDVSGSMAADDLKPTRMEAAKAAAVDFVKRQPSSVQIGVVAFTDNGFAVQAPTNDKNAILDSINRLAPQRGTSLAHGILAALNTINASTGDLPATSGSSTTVAPTPTPTPTPVPKGVYKPAVIVLLSDGENNELPDPASAAQTASDQGVRIYTVGIGSPAGVNLHINGFIVHTQLDEAMLQQIAAVTGGEYYNAESAQDLLKIYDNLDIQLVIKPEKTEVTSLFAGASLFVMLIGGVFSLLWFSRLP